MTKHHADTPAGELATEVVPAPSPFPVWPRDLRAELAAAHVGLSVPMIHSERTAAATRSNVRPPA